MRVLHHVGIVSNEKREGAMFNSDLGCWITDIAESANKIEFLTFEKDSPMPELVKTQTHLAYVVPSLDEALIGAKLIFGPYDVNESLTIAFVEEEGISVELMEMK